jgi:putative aldouronate transport system permease protein
MSLFRKTPADRMYQMLFYAILAVLAFSTLYPFIYFFALSFNDGRDALKGGIYFFPRMFSLENYKRAFEYPNMVESFMITITRTVSVTVVSVFLTALMAYAFTIKTLPFRRQLRFFFYFTTLVSGGLIPTFILYRQLKIFNTFWVLFLPMLFSFWNTLIMRAYFNGIPASLSESARIDGASELRIFLWIIIPLSLPVMATISLYNGVGAWNDWFTGAFFISTNSLRPAATRLQQIIAEASFESSQIASGANTQNVNEALQSTRLTGATPESLRMAFIIITITPIICVYPFLQKYFVKGVMVGSIKE